jgi:hypothetical protein
MGGIVVILIVIGLYLVSHKYDLYYIFWWIDWAQHILGGIGIGLVAVSLWPNYWLRNIGIAGTIGIGWEIFERIGNIYLPNYINYGGTGDTIIDVFCAIIGTSLVLLATRE